MSSKAGVVVVVSGQDDTGQVFAAIKQHLAETEAAAQRTSASFKGISEQAVPQFAAASAAVRAFEGSLSVRATERFLTGILGLGPALQAAFPVIGALAFIDVLAQGAERVAKFAGDVADMQAELNIGWSEAAVGKFVGLGDAIKQADEEMELLAKDIDAANEASTASDNRFIELTQGRAASLRAEKEQLDQKVQSLQRVLEVTEKAYEIDKKASEVKPAGAGVMTSRGTAQGATNVNHGGTDGALKAREAAEQDAKQAQSIQAEIEKLAKSARNTAVDAAKAQAEEDKENLTRATAAQHQLAAARMEADRAALAEQKRQHVMSIAEEAEFWQSKLTTFKQGSAQYLQVLDELNRLSAAAAREDLETRKEVTRAAIEDAKEAQRQSEEATEAITNLWEDDLRAQEAAAEEEAKAAQVRAAATAKIAEANVEHARAAKSITEEAAAQAKATIKAQEYAAEIAALTAEFQELQEIQARGGDTSKKQADITDQITSLRGDAAAAAVVAAPIAQTNNGLQDEAEKFAHGVFDPLFNFGERWDKQWKQIRSNMLRDVGQMAESQLFGALFGDPAGRGGKGLDGSGGHRGVAGQATGIVGSLIGLFTKKSQATSNGGLGSGAGTVPSAAASVLQMGKSALSGSGGGGIQVILNNNAAPMEVTQTQQSGGSGADPEGMVIQIMLKQLETNGPIAQGITGLLTTL